MLESALQRATLQRPTAPGIVVATLEQWADEQCVKLSFIDLATPTQNAFIESVNARVRRELLNPNHFWTILELNETADAWRLQCSTWHSHSGLFGKRPRIS
jgi:putative transposase